jgi:hypothetical protein
VLGIAAPVLLLAVWLSSAPGGPAAATPRIASAAAVLPTPSLTPGAVSLLTATDLCGGARPSRRVSIATRDSVIASYRMQRVAADAYELDALITPELGGTTDVENLWPQMYTSPVWNARVKDELERLLPELVCRGEVTLAHAQQEIASDWIATYRRYFKTDMPLRAHVGPPLEDGDDLEFEPEVMAPSLLAFSKPAGVR